MFGTKWNIWVATGIGLAKLEKLEKRAKDGFLKGRGQTPATNLHKSLTGFLENLVSCVGTPQTLKIPFLSILGRSNAGCSVHGDGCSVFSRCSQVGNCPQFVLLNLCCYLGDFCKLTLM